MRKEQLNIFIILLKFAIASGKIKVSDSRREFSDRR